MAAFSHACWCLDKCIQLRRPPCNNLHVVCICAVTQFHSCFLLCSQFFASFVAPESSWDVVLDPASGIDPYRRSQLETNGPNFDRWVKAGYDSSAAHTYLDVSHASSIWLLAPSQVPCPLYLNRYAVSALGQRWHRSSW